MCDKNHLQITRKNKNKLFIKKLATSSVFRYTLIFHNQFHGVCHSSSVFVYIYF